MSETWVINENPTISLNEFDITDFTFDFWTSENGVNIVKRTDGNNFYCDSTLFEFGFFDSDTYTMNVVVKNSVGGMDWHIERQILDYSDSFSFDDFTTEQQLQMRTVVFHQAPTGDLLTWLQANAVKQETLKLLTPSLSLLLNPAKLQIEDIDSNSYQIEIYKDGELYDTIFAQKMQLDAPVISLNDNILSFANVEGAIGYDLYKDSELYENLVSSPIVLSELGSYQVKAIGDNIDYLDSELSNTVVLLPQISSPQNITADGTTIEFDPVENAESYEVFADGASIGEQEVN